MTGDRNVAVLMFLAVAMVAFVSVQAQLTPEEQNISIAFDDMWNSLTPEEQAYYGDCAFPVKPLPCYYLGTCYCHAHGDIRYMTCDKRQFRYNTSPDHIGFMAMPACPMWYVLTKHEYFNGPPKTRLKAVKFGCWQSSVTVFFKSTFTGTYTLEVIDGPGTPVILTTTITKEEFLFEGTYFRITVVWLNAHIPGYYLSIECKFFKITLYIARHCMVIKIPPIWCHRILGICGDWNTFPLNDETILDIPTSDASDWGPLVEESSPLWP
ncbi:uncharacterized protein LOC106161131 [Lingula anatina]|uniref:Uncharacterized protein LOC106161131 n=1 Tax=Lingula anatina TaxID=7574 RepID=A0A1S3I5B1_LINAN|nr:uncharacterized protein LOC106161131 [Lingula anatina]|eukprot:XP_013393452.1 uncharacterized protein LOC106161131 [Lingula anatina]